MSRKLLRGAVALALSLACVSARARAQDVKDLALVSRANHGAVDLFAIGPEGSTAHLWQNVEDGPWAGVEPLGGDSRRIAAIERSDDRFEVFVIGYDGAIWHNWQAPETFWWSGWESLGGWGSQVTAAAAGAGRSAVFHIGTEGWVYFAWRDALESGLREWESLGIRAIAIAATPAQNGWLTLFAVTEDRLVWRFTFEPTSFSFMEWEWEELGGEADQLSGIRTAAGTYAISATTPDGAVWIKSQLDIGLWTDWQGLGGVADRISLAETPSGLAIAALGRDGHVWRTRQDEGGSWSDWENVVETEPLEARFTGTAVVEIPDQGVTAERPLELGLRFNLDRTRVEISEFPEIVTDPFDTPFGSSRSTVTLVGAGVGSFEPYSGALEIPVTLRFDQSIDVPLVDEDATARFFLSTDAPRGRALDRESAEITLAAGSRFDGLGSSYNPLDGNTVRLTLKGEIDPVP